jgi:long-chain fatty acid transport protein
MALRNKLMAAAVAAAFAPVAAWATNGMNLEGYGPIATGMGVHPLRTTTVRQR